jgi:signal transduction histidine kinase
MFRLVNNLLDISIIESVGLTLNCNLSNYVGFVEDEVIKNRSIADQIGVKIEFISSQKAINVSFDVVKMQQVVNNLISNALKYSTTGDSIKVTISVKGNIVITSVEDSGPGISTENLETIFKKFTQLRTPVNLQKKGTGLGLSIVKGIIEAHGGRIYVQSVLNKGSNFIFELPIPN